MPLRTLTHTTTFDPNLKRGVSFTGILDPVELTQKLQTNFPTASACPIYRWFVQQGDLVVDAYDYEPPTESDRRARKTATLDKSIGNLMMSNLPGWAGLPDKETSPVFYTNPQTATDDAPPGRVFRGVLAPDAQLVIAPTPRIRYAFRYAMEQFGLTKAEFGPMGKLHGTFRSLWGAYEMEFPTDWQLFLHSLEEIADEKIRPQKKRSPGVEAVLETLIKNKTDLIGFFDNAFSPSNNGFEVVRYADAQRSKYPDNELWTDSPCLLVAEQVFEKIIQ